MLYNKASTQTHAGFEQYYYVRQHGAAVIVPKVYYKNKNNWYTEARYNYDEAQSFSINFGKEFAKKDRLSYSFIPLAGAVAGRLNGGSLGLNMEMDYQNLFLSTESQYTFSIDDKRNDFFFSWSEFGYQICKSIYGGLALQQTHFLKTINKWEPGMIVGFLYKDFTFPLYTFNPLTQKRYFVLGINMEWNYKKSKKTRYNDPLLSKSNGIKIPLPFMNYITF